MHSRNPLYILRNLDNCQRWRFIAQMYTVLIAENEPWVLKGIVEMVKSAGEEFQVVGECKEWKRSVEHDSGSVADALDYGYHDA